MLRATIALGIVLSTGMAAAAGPQAQVNRVVRPPPPPPRVTVPGVTVSAPFCEAAKRPVSSQCRVGWETASDRYADCSWGMSDGRAVDSKGQSMYGYTIVPSAGTHSVDWGDGNDAAGNPRLWCVSDNDRSWVLYITADDIVPHQPLVHVTQFSDVPGDAYVEASTDVSNANGDVILVIQSQSDNGAWVDEATSAQAQYVNTVVKNASGRSIRLELRAANRFRWGKFAGVNLSHANLFVQRCYEDASNPGQCIGGGS